MYINSSDSCRFIHTLMIFLKSVNGLILRNEPPSSHHMNIWQAESKIITVVKSIAEIFIEIITVFPGSSQTNSAKFTTGVTLDLFLYLYIYTNLSGALDTVKRSVLQIIL